MLAPRGMTQFVNQFLYCVEGEMNHAKFNHDLLIR